MAKYRKKPVVIEAVQWFKYGDHPSVKAGFKDAAGRVGDVRMCGIWPKGMQKIDCPIIKTLEGWHEVTPGDWIIAGVKGEMYPCKDEIFRMTYEPAAHPAAQAEEKHG